MCDEHPNYAVSDTGMVFAYHPDGLIPLKIDISNGYPRVKLDGKKEYVSRLVANEFLEKPEPDKTKLFFLDNNTKNCCAKNLVWLTPSEVQKFSQYTIEYRLKELGRRV